MIGKAGAATIKFEKAKTVCFSGHRTLPTSEELASLESRLFSEIDKAVFGGYDTFLFGGAMGFDLLTAGRVIIRKKIVKMGDPKHIRLIAIIPFEELTTKWSESDRELYYDTLPLCDEVVTLSAHYHDKAYYDRNKFMVDRSSRLICYWNGSPRSGTGQTVRLAREQGLEIINLHQK